LSFLGRQDDGAYGDLLVITSRRLDLVDARRLLDAAAERSSQIGVPMCTAVTDGSGVLIAFERADGGKVSSVTIAMDKAFTAATSRRPTSFYGGASQPGGPAWGIDKTNHGRFCVIGGGVPIIVESEVVGAIGVSSGTAAQDEDVACWAVRAFSDADELQDDA